MRHHHNNIQAAIWLIGIAFLVLSHRWWPGILVLIGISMVVGAFARGESQPNPPYNPPAQMPFQPPSAPTPPAPPMPNPLEGFTPPAPRSYYDLSWLPAHCDACGGPLNVNGLKILDQNTAVCPYCNTKIIKPS